MERKEGGKYEKEHFISFELFTVNVNVSEHFSFLSKYPVLQFTTLSFCVTG